MAERFIEASSPTSNGYFLWIDPNGGTDYSNVVCLLDFNFNLSNATNNSTTMCGPTSSAGDQTQTINLNAQYILDVDTGRISAPDIFTLSQDRTTFSWMIGRETPDAGDITKTGNGFFSSYTESFSASNRAGFTGTISVDGTVLQVEEAGS